MTVAEIIKGCRAGKAAAQRELYDRFGPVLMGLIRRYIRQAEDAEDVFVDTMFKIMTKVDTYRDEGSFEGWMKRIAVNESLMHLRKNRQMQVVREVEEEVADDQFSVVSQLQANDILDLLDELPDGYRTVFNLYVVEGYKHREIAELLGISINTSKSQLILAKRRMRELLKKNIVKAG